MTQASRVEERRTVGRPAAALVLLLDMGKGVLSVVIARVVSDTAGVESAAALAALAGHNWPVFLAFRGGRGTATGWGSLLILSPISGLAAAVVGVPLVATTRYVSLGSIAAGAAGGTRVAVGEASPPQAASVRARNSASTNTVFKLAL